VPKIYLKEKTKRLANADESSKGSMLKSFHFVDNEKVDMFLGLQLSQKLGLKLDLEELNAIFKPQDTYMMVRSTAVLDLG
jgi:hypothetical protein